jgi:phenylalanyl-tRNA synthetase beta chain
MKIPISWLQDFVDTAGLSVEEIALKLTLAGLEVTEIRYVGLPMPERSEDEPHEFKTGGIAWDPSKIVVAEIREVMPHPNADRLTLLDLFDGREQHTVLTGAPNLFHLKGTGKLSPPLKAAYAKEGAVLYDGHSETVQLTTLRRTKIRGVESYSMVCSEKELGISDEHEGIILLPADAPVGKALADYMGDAVLEIDIQANMARNTSVLGVARELAALTGRKLRRPIPKYSSAGPAVDKTVSVDISDPNLNPRFVLGLIRDVEIRESPYEIQRRLKLAGMRPLNSIVDATNYAMLERGQPLHAFDYDALQKRAGKGKIRISTRTAAPGEKLTTLDGIERSLSPLNVLVCDDKGPLSVAGVMGGAESEVAETTRNVLLEGAAWNYINIRRTSRELNLPSEASFRFSRGVHPALADMGVKRCLQLMGEWSGGTIAPGLVDQYPLKPKTPKISFTRNDVRRLLGVDLTSREIARLLEALEFKVTVSGATKGRSKAPPKRRVASTEAERITVSPPASRMDIGEGLIGLADVLEEIARMVGYDRIPSTTMADPLPPQIGNADHEWDERLRDTLVALEFDEVVSYRLTSPEREARLSVPAEHVRVSNPIAPERSVLRRSLLASVLDDMERNARLTNSMAFFEIGPVFEPRDGELPEEAHRLALAMTGARHPASWDTPDEAAFDFFDLKGRVELMLQALRASEIEYGIAAEAPYLHPGKSAQVMQAGRVIGAFGELHPLVKQQYELGPRPVLVGEFDLDRLREFRPDYSATAVAEFPPVLEDIAIIVQDSVPASRVEAAIRSAGRPELSGVRLFDLYRGEQVGPGKKSLAYSLTYDAPDRTLTDSEAAAIRKRIVRSLEQEFGAVLRG